MNRHISALYCDHDELQLGDYYFFFMYNIEIHGTQHIQTYIEGCVPCNNILKHFTLL